MLITLVLLGIERLINTLLAQELSSSHHHIALMDKTIRIHIHTPTLTLDMRFYENGVRFLPVHESIFESLDDEFIKNPDCIVSLSKGTDIIKLLDNPYQKVNISGDTQIWEHMQALIIEALPILNTKNQNFWQSFNLSGDWIKAILRKVN